MTKTFEQLQKKFFRPHNFEIDLVDSSTNRRNMYRPRGGRNDHELVILMSLFCAERNRQCDTWKREKTTYKDIQDVDLPLCSWGSYVSSWCIVTHLILKGALYSSIVYKMQEALPSSEVQLYFFVPASSG